MPPRFRPAQGGGEGRRTVVGSDDPGIERRGDAREEERRRRSFERPREEERAFDTDGTMWAPNVWCGDTREEERCRRVSDRPREEERAAELWWGPMTPE
ncbi:hypothetical protein IMCC21224_111513 [Puniceibacterium sp. IMCC21224]|nr:hypothetical protein IMCC21224_111513 [Puniceibacterium sp. IMCC21224]